jgi:hypothetical protein
MRLLQFFLVPFLFLHTNAQLREHCIGCPSYPFGGTIIKTDSLNGMPAIQLTFNGNNIFLPVDVEIKTTLINLHALDSLIKEGIVHIEANKKYVEKDTVILPPLRWMDHRLENISAVVMNDLPSTFILGQNAFASAGIAFTNGYWPPSEFVLFKELSKEATILDTGYVTRKRLNLFFKGIKLFDNQHYTEAIPYFKLYNWMHIDSIYGYHWLARALHAKQQFRHNIEAGDMYKRTLQIALRDTQRFKSQGLEAASYLAVFANNYLNDKQQTLTYLKQAIRFDSTNSNILKSISLLETSIKTNTQTDIRFPDYRNNYKGLSAKD